MDQQTFLDLRLKANRNEDLSLEELTEAVIFIRQGRRSAEEKKEKKRAKKEENKTIQDILNMEF